MYLIPITNFIEYLSKDESYKHSVDIEHENENHEENEDVSSIITTNFMLI